MTEIQKQCFDVFTPAGEGLSLTSEKGREYMGLEGSKYPDIAYNVRHFFKLMEGKLGFPDTLIGQEDRESFNWLLRLTYPEILIDLADLIYVQHERPAVFLNFDHIHMNLRREHRDADPVWATNLGVRVDRIFRLLSARIKYDPKLFNDEEIVHCLSSGYCLYLWRTENFPWESPDLPTDVKGPVVDIATGLSGYSMIHAWPENGPQLILTDRMPFIIQGLTQYREKLGKKNIEIIDQDFPGGKKGWRAETVLANKFLHHLHRPERQEFLRQIFECLEAGGELSILDTDLEYQLLCQSVKYRDRLIEGYPETLVEIESGFCQNLVKDMKAMGYQILHFDFHEYHDETDAYSQKHGDNLALKFLGFEIIAKKPTV
jgi:hypothetical protein